MTPLIGDEPTFKICLLLGFELLATLTRRLLRLLRPTQPTEGRRLAERGDFIGSKGATDHGLGVLQPDALSGQRLDRIELRRHQTITQSSASSSSPSGTQPVRTLPFAVLMRMAPWQTSSSVTKHSASILSFTHSRLTVDSGSNQR